MNPLALTGFLGGLDDLSLYAKPDLFNGSCTGERLSRSCASPFRGPGDPVLGAHAGGGEPPPDARRPFPAPASRSRAVVVFVRSGPCLVTSRSHARGPSPFKAWLPSFPSTNGVGWVPQASASLVPASQARATLADLIQSGLSPGPCPCPHGQTSVVIIINNDHRAM
jgi:hypothetical protein